MKRDAILLRSQYWAQENLALLQLLLRHLEKLRPQEQYSGVKFEATAKYELYQKFCTGASVILQYTGCRILQYKHEKMCGDVRT